MTASVEPEKFFDADSIIRIKDFAYQHGKSVQIYLHIIGLLIRDKFLKEHQGNTFMNHPTSVLADFFASLNNSCNSQVLSMRNRRSTKFIL